MTGPDTLNITNAPLDLDADFATVPDDDLGLMLAMVMLASIDAAFDGNREAVTELDELAATMRSELRRRRSTEECPTCHGCGYELDSTGDAVPCGSCAGQDEPDDWSPGAAPASRGRSRGEPS